MIRRRMTSALMLVTMALVVLSTTGLAKVNISVTICCEQLDRHEWLISTAEAYMKANPDVEVEPLVDVGLSQLVTLIAGGVAPDLMWIGQAWGSEIGFLMPLTEFYSKNAAFKRDLVPGMVDGFTFNGVSYAIPFSASSRLITYNAELLLRSGLQPPSKDWMLDDMISMAKKITRDTSGDVVPDIWGVALNWQPWTFFAYGDSIYTEDGRGANIYQEAIIQSAGIWCDAWSGKLGIMPSWVVGVDDSPGDLFTQGRLGFWDIGVFEVPFIRDRVGFEWDVQEFPLMEYRGEYRRGGAWTGEGYGIYRDTKNPDEVARFALYMLSPQNLARLTEAGAIMPASRQTLSSSFLRSGQEPRNMRAFVDALDYQMAAWAHPAFGYVMDHMFQPIWNTTEAHNGTVPVQNLLETSQKALQRALDEFWATVD